jgi:hypothetical protein
MDKVQKSILNANFAVEEDSTEPVAEMNRALHGSTIEAAPVEEALPVEEPVKKSSKKKTEEVTETVEDENREDNN